MVGTITTVEAERFDRISIKRWIVACTLMIFMYDFAVYVRYFFTDKKRSGRDDEARLCRMHCDQSQRVVLKDTPFRCSMSTETILIFKSHHTPPKEAL